jgi:hypothetical protein
MKYEFIIVNDYFAQAGNKEVDWIMGRLYEMKRDGYWSAHKNSYLPIMQDDMVSLHGILKDKEKNEIILGFKIIPYSTCQKYSIPFAVEDYKSESTKEDVERLNALVEEYTGNGKDISYTGGWTINPKYKGMGLGSEFKEIYTAMHYHMHIHFNLSLYIGIGVKNFKTDKFFNQVWGSIPLTGIENKFSSASYLDCILMYGDLSEAAFQKRSLAKKYNDIWESRLEFDGSSIAANKSA